MQRWSSYLTPFPTQGEKEKNGRENLLQQHTNRQQNKILTRPLQRGSNPFVFSLAVRNSFRILHGRSVFPNPLLLHSKRENPKNLQEPTWKWIE